MMCRIEWVSVSASDYVKALSVISPKLFNRYFYGDWTLEQLDDAIQKRIRE